MSKVASGRFVLRLPPKIHESLRAHASGRGLSLNAVCQRAIEEYLAQSEHGTTGNARQSVIASEVQELFGDSLLGIVLFGSVARGESREGSDIDLLIVLNQDLALSRNLYSLWDERFGAIERNPHFVHVPVRATDAGSLWLEASVDGVIYFDRDGTVSRFLGSIHRLIASGRLKQRWAYGHPLASDYLRRAGHRLKALQVLFEEESWADVVREAQELVEITLKALLRAARIETPGIHDVSPVLEQNREMLPAGIRPRVDELLRISRFLRRDRELAFYGSEDLTPSEFYRRDDAATALAHARLVYAEVFEAMKE